MTDVFYCGIKNRLSSIGSNMALLIKAVEEVYFPPFIIFNHKFLIRINLEQIIIFLIVLRVYKQML